MAAGLLPPAHHGPSPGYQQPQQRSGAESRAAHPGPGRRGLRRQGKRLGALGVTPAWAAAVAARGGVGDLRRLREGDCRCRLDGSSTARSRSRRSAPGLRTAPRWLRVRCWAPRAPWRSVRWCAAWLGCSGATADEAPCTSQPVTR